MTASSLGSTPDAGRAAGGRTSTGVSRIETMFEGLRARGIAGFVPFIMAGDPDLPTTLELMRAAAVGGADLIELGVPFSDPMADGPLLQRSAERALAKATMLPGVLETVARFRREFSVPVILFGYANPFFRYGAERLARDAAASGAEGILCVDVPPEEADELQGAVDAAGLALVFVLAPTSDDRRLARVLERARGFVYYVSITGVTGAAAPVAQQVAAMVRRVRARTSLAVGVGFGIRTPEQAVEMARVADAVVVGTAVMKLVEDHARDAVVPAVSEFLTRMAAAVHGARREHGGEGR